ncbi:hypothetical protein NPIL_112611 [Nephila pilipes]|uniref:Uncharacterized protein n=1 Tax=Nephila pilipes TaxID=299642 RepID=A0A8X6T614_NEPPI|nr:hypothetical protein NPIL_112611 [Nephila pilipes]
MTCTLIDACPLKLLFRWREVYTMLVISPTTLFLKSSPHSLLVALTRENLRWVDVMAAFQLAANSGNPRHWCTFSIEPSRSCSLKRILLSMDYRKAHIQSLYYME